MTEVDRTGENMFRRAVVDLQLDRHGGQMSSQIVDRRGGQM